MKNIKIIIVGVVLSVLLPSCAKYLEVVPDNTLTLEDMFQNRENAINALARAYSFLPRESDTHNTTWTLGDEYIGRLDLNNTTTNLRAIRIMRGLQEPNSPILGMWSGTSGAKHLYRGINNCEVFLNYIDLARDMTEVEIRDWSAQVKFLKAYYCWLLVQKYGPIVLPQGEMIDPDASSDNLFRPRSKVEECFDYIIELMDEAIPNLEEIKGSTEWGQIDQIAAKAIKARVLFFRASPFYNGNREYYGDFYDHNGEPFFSMTVDNEKWKKAADALTEAIQIAEYNGKSLYKYTREPYPYDYESFEVNEEKMRTLYSLRMVVCDPWNTELCWANSNVNYYQEGELSSSTNMRLPPGYNEAGDMNTAQYSWQWLGASYQVLERFYTKNGLPMDEDLTFDMEKIHELYITPGLDDPEYQPLQGYMQPGSETINMYMNREPRLYANMAITGGFWRAHSVRINTMMYMNTDGGYSSSVHQTDFFPCAIGIKKMSHVESRSGAWQRTIKFPFPIIRLADLYLMKAEALNEYSGPSAEVYELINKVRERAGIPAVQVAWSDASLAKTLNKHTSKEGLREIIVQERGNEFAFEGLRYWDMHRLKRCVNEYNTPIYGWKHDGATAQTFFVMEAKQLRRFTLRDYLWPISLDELNTNGNLIQNPGW